MSKSKMTTVIISLFLTTFLLFLGGCGEGDKSIRIFGHVQKLNGSPFSFGEVVFNNNSNPILSTKADSFGYFELNIQEQLLSENLAFLYFEFDDSVLSKIELHSDSINNNSININFRIGRYISQEGKSLVDSLTDKMLPQFQKYSEEVDSLLQGIKEIDLKNNFKDDYRIGVDSSLFNIQTRLIGFKVNLDYNLTWLTRDIQFVQQGNLSTSDLRVTAHSSKVFLDSFKVKYDSIIEVLHLSLNPKKHEQI